MSEPSVGASVFHKHILSIFIADVDQETFEAFCHCWKENNEQCLSLQVDEGAMLESECILKVSSLCKTDFGTGRLALTDKRYLICG